MKKVILTSLTLLFAVFAASAQTVSGNVEIELIRHATLKIYYGGDVILLDPMLNDATENVTIKAGDITYNYAITSDLPYPASEVVEDATAVLLTDTSDDHFDETAIELINKHLPLLVQPNDENTLKANGFRNVVGVTSAVRVGNTRFIRVLGTRGSKLMNKRMGSVAGYVITRTGLPTIYVVGDCIFDNTVRNTIQKYRPGIIVVNSGGATIMDIPVMMDAAQTIELARFAPDATVVAVGLGAVDNSPVTRESLIRMATRHDLDIQVPGEAEVLRF